MQTPLATAARYLDLCEREGALTDALEQLTTITDARELRCEFVDLANLDLEALVELAEVRGARREVAAVLGLSDGSATDGGNETISGDPPPACVIPTVEAIPHRAGCYLLSGPANDGDGVISPEWHALVTQEQLVVLGMALIEPLAEYAQAMRRERQHAPLPVAG